MQKLPAERSDSWTSDWASQLGVPKLGSAAHVAYIGERRWSFYLLGEMEPTEDKAIFLKVQSTLGSGKGRVEQTRVREETGVCGSEKRAQGTATRNPCACAESLYHRRHLSWVEHAPPCDISLWQNNCPTLPSPCRPNLWIFCPVKESVAGPRYRGLGTLKGCQ